MNGSKREQERPGACTIEHPAIVSRYSRRDALADGVLVDVTEAAKEAGFRYPVALTLAVHERYVRIPRGVVGQDESGRCWDILWMSRQAIRKSDPGAARVSVQLHVRNDNDRAELVSLAAVVGPGDQGEPVITIMLPEES